MNHEFDEVLPARFADPPLLLVCRRCGETTPPFLAFAPADQLTEDDRVMLAREFPNVEIVDNPTVPWDQYRRVFVANSRLTGGRAGPFCARGDRPLDEPDMPRFSTVGGQAFIAPVGTHIHSAMWRHLGWTS